MRPPLMLMRLSWEVLVYDLVTAQVGIEREGDGERGAIGYMKDFAWFCIGGVDGKNALNIRGKNLKNSG
jgi:hypothetical protein